MPKQTVTIIKEGRRGTGKKEPLKESSFEMYIQIQKEKEEKEVRKTNWGIKQLKKEGKVQSIAVFLFAMREGTKWMNG